MKNIWKKFMSEESGQGMVEYGLILALIAIVLIAILVSMSETIKGPFQVVDTALASANKKS